MHPALRLEEILLNIFGHFPEPKCIVPGIVSVATTCRAFKEPALDVLWGDLRDVSPLVRCLPEARYPRSDSRTTYSFRRSLTQREWKTLRSYSRRIRSMKSVDNMVVDDKAVTILTSPPTPEPLFPNLRRLTHCSHVQPVSLLRLPFPSLVHLDLTFNGGILCSLQDNLRLFPDFSPNIRSLALTFIYITDQIEHDATSIDYISSWIRQWNHLESVTCSIPLSMNTLRHLSCIPAFSQLTLSLSPAILPPDVSLFFSGLHTLEIATTYLETAALFLSQTRLPVLTGIITNIHSSPSPQELHSFLCSVKTSGTAPGIERLLLPQMSFGVNTGMRFCLASDGLMPCMAFSNLRELSVNLDWNVFLNTDDLLSLASAWPHLEDISINAQWGWKTHSSGITPNGFLRLLQTCPSLNRVALAWDIREYTEIPPNGLLEQYGLTFPKEFYLDVLDTMIEPEHMPAVTALFVDIFADAPWVSMSAWCIWKNQHAYIDCAGRRRRWYDVFANCPRYPAK